MIGEGLKINTTLTKLELEYNDIQPSGYAQIAKCLLENPMNQTNEPNETFLKDFINNKLRKVAFKSSSYDSSDDEDDQEGEYKVDFVFDCLQIN